MSTPTPDPTPDRFVPIFAAVAKAREYIDAARAQVDESDAQLCEAMRNLASAMGMFGEPPPTEAENPPQTPPGAMHKLRR